MAHIEIRPCSLNEIAVEAFNYKHNTKSLGEHKDYLHDHLVEAFGVYRDGVLGGYVFSMKVDDKYTMDGYHSGADSFSAVKAGRLLCERLFKITDEIWTSHKKTERSATAVCKRIGFTPLCTVDDNIVMINRR